jgi:hypothetical protein
MLTAPDYTPLAAFFGEGDGPNTSAPGLRVCLREADVIIGIDVMSGDELLVFGRAFLQELIDSGQASRVARLVEIGIDDGTEDLDRLLTLVRELRGRHDYLGRRG